MTAIAIAGVGLCTAQGSAADLRAGTPPAPPAPLPWPRPAWATCPIGFAARGVDPSLRGAARWRALAAAALAECGAPDDAAIVIGSCNGGADALDAAAWRDAFDATALVPGRGAVPIASAACASGLHALWLGAIALAAGRDEIVVLAVDTLDPASVGNFEALRVLAAAPTPWQVTATGFVPGEAAVALRLVRARDGDGLPRLRGPALAHDRGDDALAGLAAAVAPPSAGRVVGQGTGPLAIDRRELAALAALPIDVPLATALAHFGHTVGASGLLSVALAALAPPAALAMAAPAAVDGRALGAGGGDALVVCRALGDACAAVGVAAAGAPPPPGPSTWGARVLPPPMHVPWLRGFAAAAPAHRPAVVPAAVLIFLDEPLAPPDRSVIGGRLLPSVVLEITPGFAGQVVARAWGYPGPVICLVGGDPDSRRALAGTCRLVLGGVSVITIEGVGADRDVDWQR